MISSNHNKTLIYIDATVENYEDLCQGVRLESKVIILDPAQDGIAQITKDLRNRVNCTAPGIQALHIVSHGSPGCLYLGNTQLNLDSLDQYKDQLQQWSGALTTDAEILLYGCNVAQEEYQTFDPHSNPTDQVSLTSPTVSPFIQKLQHLTGAKIAASSTKIGHQTLGGNWKLDVYTDKILSPLAFTSSTQENYAGVLATFTVTNANDEGPGSLRDAIEQANDNDDPNGNIIEFDPTVFSTPQTITLGSQLNIRDRNGNSLTINGPGAENLTINGPGNGNVFRVNTNTPETVVRISGLTIQNANNGIRNDGGEGILEVDSSIITDNLRIGILSSGQIRVTNSIFSNNNNQGINVSGSNSIIQGNTFVSTTQNAQGQPSQGTGVRVFTPNNAEIATTNVSIIDNLIGTDANGTAEIGHRNQGIEITQSIGTQITGNVISGNGGEGITISDSANNTVVQGNLIGVAPDGTTPLTNGNNGITVEDSTGTIIGGANPGEGNVISGNERDGIFITNGSSNNTILGNFIGVNAVGDAAISNTNNGVRILGSASNTIGGVNPGEGNIISGNGADGVLITDSNDDEPIPSSENRILGNIIGLDVTGNIDIGNANHGVLIDASINNDIGFNRIENPEVTGTERNVISGNQANGILITNGSTGNQILGNLIGINAGGNTAIPNGSLTIDDPPELVGGIGIEIQNSANNIIGRNGLAEDNIISGNLAEGILIRGEESTGNTIQSNVVGLDSTGVSAIPNQSDGIIVNGVTNSIIGGSEAGQGNTISGNLGNGLLLTPGSNASQVQGNFIGTNRAGDSAVGNGENGLLLNGVTETSIVGNFVSGNTANGVSLLNESSGNTIQGNSIGINAAGDTAIANQNNGLEINGVNNTIEGNTISGNTANGLVLTNGSNASQVLGNTIGTSRAGDAAVGNGVNGLILDGITETNIVGNLVSGNIGNGVSLLNASSGNTIQSNTIGVTAAGDVGIGNGANGLEINGANNTIGGLEPGLGNIISGNGGEGVILTSGSDTSQILGNTIGASRGGDAAIGNAGNGLILDGTSQSTIIGNLVSGNTGNGVSLLNASSGNTIQANTIGVTAAGDVAIGNGANGLEINGANNTIGGPEAGLGNTIAFNGGDGITVVNEASVSNGILGNSIFSNGEGNETAIGIDLEDDGVTVNDPGDTDTGANTRQNYPELILAEPVGNDTVVAGRLNSLPNTTYRIEFFQNTAADASGNGQGQTFIAATDVTTDAEGNAQFSETFSDTGDLSGQFITATATSAAPGNNTSEFSAAVEISTPNIIITPTEISLPEGNTDTVDYTYTISVSKPSTQEIVVNYNTSDGTGENAATLADNDYIEASGSLTFPASLSEPSASQTFTVQGNGDQKFEADEIFNLSAEAVGFGNMVTPTATAIIQNDDRPPSITISDVTVNEGDDIATFTLTTSFASGFAATLDYATTDNTAVAGSDYVATTGSITIPVGETTASFEVPLLDDDLEEADKIFGVTLTNLVGIDVENSITTATATIVDDDFSPVLNLDADNSSNTPINDYQTNFSAGGNAVAIADTDVSITDADSTSLATATITLGNPLDLGNESLSIVGSLPDTITASEYNPVSGQLTLSGVASLADYQTAFSQIIYNNTSLIPNTQPRKIESIVSDGINFSNTATTTVNLSTVNLPPVANNDIIITRTNTAITFNITNNDFDPDGVIVPDTVELDLTGLNNSAEAELDPLGNLTFTPTPDFAGIVTIPYTIEDNQGESASAQISITVNPSTNQPPVSGNIVTEIIPNTPTPIAIPPLNGTDIDGTIARFQITRPPLNGQLFLNGEIVTQGQIVTPEDVGNLTFIPTPGFVGLAEFEYTGFDNNNAASTTPATVVIPVSSSNQVPIAADKIAPPNSPTNTPVAIPVLTATDAEGDITAFRITRLPTGSTLLLNGVPLTSVPADIAVADAANLSYIGGENFIGDSFSYTAIDTQGTEDPTPATVLLPASTPENILPITANQIGPVTANLPTPVSLPTLQATDADGNIASFTITELPAGGVLSLADVAVEAGQVIPADQENQLTFTPNPNFSGLTQFSYVATDNQDGTDATPATFNLLVNVTNVPPLPLNSAAPLLKNVSTQVPLPPLTSTNDENIVSFTLVELPIGGQVFLNGEAVTLNQVIPVEQAGQLTFTSNVDFSGSTTLKFTATDITGVSTQQVAEISLFILPNLLPTAQSFNFININPTSAPLGLPTLTGQDEDGEIVSFSFTNIPSASQGQLFVGETAISNLNQARAISVEQAANIQFEANENFVGEIVLNYIANDNDGQSSEPASISINVLPRTPSIEFNIPPSEPVVEEIIVADIDNNGTAIPIPPLTANNLDGDVESFSILELLPEAVGQLLLDGAIVTNLSQVTELTIAQAAQLSFIPNPTFSGEVQLRYTATNSLGLTSSSSRIVLEVPNTSSENSTLPNDLSAEVLAFTSSLAGLLQSYSFITESIALNAIESSIEGTENDDILTGSDIAEQIVSLGENDEIIALGGDDNAFGNIGNDTIDAGEGNDVVEGGAGEDFVIGSVGSDTLIGGAETDILIGGSNLVEAPDTEGEDLIDGGDGDDSIFGNQGTDTLIGGEGNDEIFSGKDADLASGEAGNDTIFGDLDDDSISGGEGNDFLLGNQGNDTISGGEGNDEIFGGQGNDLLFGNEGNDAVYGDLGEDSVYGNEGNDSLFGGDGNDTLIGGDDEDFLSGDAGEDILSGGEGADTFALILNSGSDVIVDFVEGEDLLGLSIGLDFDDLTIEQSETATLIRFDGQLLVTLNRINLTVITEDDFTTI
ncbi:MAG: DUF4347 domain-containing protein [Cyanobacteria bacterium J06592_8]